MIISRASASRGSAAAVLFLATLPFAARASAADEGAARFSAHGCASCHRVGPRGGDAGPDLTLAGHRRSRAWLLAWLKSPRHYKPDTKMPEQGLPAPDLALLADYLAVQKGQAWGEKRPWDGLSGVPAGRAIFSRAGCVACHGPEGRGGHPNPGAHGNIIPALPKLVSTYKGPELLAKIARGSKPETHGGAPAAVDMPAWAGVLSEKELEWVTKYLFMLAESAPKTVDF